MGFFWTRFVLCCRRCRCRCWWNRHQENAFAAFDRNANFVKRNTKTKLKSKPKKKPKAKPCQQHQLYPKISMRFFSSLLFFLSLNLTVQWDLFLCNQNVLCEFKYVLCTLCVQCTYACAVSWNSHRWWITMESTQFSNCLSRLVNGQQTYTHITMHVIITCKWDQRRKTSFDFRVWETKTNLITILSWTK